MPGIAKPSAAQAFALHMEDAKQLIKLVHALTNNRQRQMRIELRERIGEALRIPEKHRPELGCIESTDVFLTFKPGSAIGPQDLSDLRPLLRQAVVAACSAMETYVGDVVMEHVGPFLRRPECLPTRLGEIPLTLRQWLEIEDSYKRLGWGMRMQIVEPYVRQKASTASSSVGILLSAIGVDNWAAKVDAERGVTKGDTVELLDKVTSRRNKIAHEADREGRRRADLTPSEVEATVDALGTVVQAIERVLAAHRKP